MKNYVILFFLILSIFTIDKTYGQSKEQIQQLLDEGAGEEEKTKKTKDSKQEKVKVEKEAKAKVEKVKVEVAKEVKVKTTN